MQESIFRSVNYLKDTLFILESKVQDSNYKDSLQEKIDALEISSIKEILNDVERQFSNIKNSLSDEHYNLATDYWIEGKGQSEVAMKYHLSTRTLRRRLNDCLAVMNA